ncbi:MAG: hypothetical protein Ct9H300mP15_11970 [Gemmatimonadota bacterium]|nr:MAG: hypothetical protein Ct9H300mP15_11970 [Gemmatimonadota bacterium]
MNFIKRGRGVVVFRLFQWPYLAAVTISLTWENPASLLDDDLNRPELLATLSHTPEANIAGGRFELEPTECIAC